MKSGSFPKALVQHSPERRTLNLELRDYLYKNLYYNPVVFGLNQRALKMLEQLFNYYLAHPKEIGRGARRRAPKSGLYRAVCDYLAGMTDRYVGLEYEKIFKKTLRVGDDVRSL